MIICYGFRVACEVNLGFGCFGTVSLRFLPNCMNMMEFCADYAAIVQIWGLGAYITSKLCLYYWYHVFKLNWYELGV